MERSSKQGGRMLVSKYYPAVDHSYPRNEVIPQYDPPPKHDRPAINGFREITPKRPIDDRTGEEISLDDDRQYLARATGPWDIYWQPEARQNKDESEIHLRKQYPTLVRSPQQRRRPTEQDSGRQGSPWHTSDSPVRKPWNRQPAATYFPLPIPVALPPPGKPTVPSWQSSRPRDQPRRLSRPSGRLLAPYIQQLSPVASVATSLTTPPDSAGGTNARQCITLVDQQPLTSVEYQRPKPSLYNRQLTPPWSQGLKTSHSIPPTSPVEVQWSEKTLANRPPTPFEPERSGFSGATHFTPPGLPAKQHRTTHPSHGSISPLTLRRSQSCGRSLNTETEAVKTSSSPFGSTSALVVTTCTQRGALGETPDVAAAIAPAQFRRCRLGRIWRGITTVLSLVVCWATERMNEQHETAEFNLDS